MQPGNARPIPARAMKARALSQTRHVGILATVSKRMPGFPFASVMPYAVDAEGRPLFLISGLAIHTKNLLDDPKASLLIFEPEAEQDPLTAARMNLMGEVHPVPNAEIPAARTLYLEQHPNAEQWFEFGDFALYRMSILDVYYIGGFGEMGWVSTQDYRDASI